MNRRYFIMDTTQATEQEVTDALNSCIGIPETQRYSLDGTKLFIKCDGNHNHSSDCCTEYSYEDALVELRTPEWQEEDII